MSFQENKLLHPPPNKDIYTLHILTVSDHSVWNPLDICCVIYQSTTSLAHFSCFNWWMALWGQDQCHLYASIQYCLLGQSRVAVAADSAGYSRHPSRQPHFSFPHPGSILTRCPNHINHPLKTWRSSNSTLSSLWMSKLFTLSVIMSPRYLKSLTRRSLSPNWERALWFPATMASDLEGLTLILAVSFSPANCLGTEGHAQSEGNRTT